MSVDISSIYVAMRTHLPWQIDNRRILAMVTDSRVDSRPANRLYSQYLHHGSQKYTPGTPAARALRFAGPLLNIGLSAAVKWVV